MSDASEGRDWTDALAASRLQPLMPWLWTAGVVVVATLLRWGFDLLGTNRFPFLTYFPAIAICAMRGGWQQGVWATFASVVASMLLDDQDFDAGQTSGYLVFILANAITIGLAESARRARARAEEQAAEARDSEWRFNVMADSVPLLIWVHDADGRIQFVNRGWETFFGITQEQARRRGWQPLVHEDDKAAYVGAFFDALRNRRPFSAKARVRRADGEWRWIESHGVPRFGPRGELLSFAGTSNDVTDKRSLELERESLLESERAARSEAEAATRAKDEFLATLSHELRTPLSVIVLWARILARKYSHTSDDLKKGLALVIDNGMALSQLIGDLLDMSRIVSGRVSLDARPLDALDLLGQAVASHRPAAEAKHITLSLDAGPDPCIVFGDPTRLQQVLWNLLANAVKFTPEGGQVRVLARRVNGWLEIEVQDDGEGIAEEFLPQIFSRFRQADSTSTRRHGGLGLGLAIVKQLVELHGGEVRAASPGPGFGATFTVRLQLHESQMPQDPDSSGAWRRLDPDRVLVARLAGRRILAVEDQPDMLESMRRMLEDQGAIVTAVSSGREAFELLRARATDFDVLVSDIGMPQMDGYELIRRVRGELALTPGRLVAIAVTAYARDEDRIRAIQAGFQAHLAKPYQVGQVVSVLAQLQETIPSLPSDRGAAPRRREPGTTVAL
jgi:PAS domain S-box-containing protein